MSTIEPNPALEPVEPETLVSMEPVIDRKLPLWRLVLLLALPWWAQQLMHLAVTLSDALLAGRFLDVAQQENVASQSAQTTANYLYWFISNFTVLVSAGSTALVARFIGARDRAAAVRAANQAIILAVLFGLGGSAAGFLGVEALMDVLQLPPEASGLAADYLRPLFVSLPLQMTEAVGIACLIGAGDTVTGMWVMSSVAAINLPLAWFFLRGLGSFHGLGFVGISTGTAVSHSFGGIAVLLVLVRGRAALRIRLTDLRPDLGLMRRLLRISVPAGIDSLSVVAGQLWFLSIVNRLPTYASAAHGIALRWEGLGYMSGAAFGVAATTLVGQNLGARRPATAARSGWTAFTLGCGVMCVMGVIFYALAEPMFNLFCPRPEQQPIVRQGVPVLQLVAWTMPAVASCIIFTGALRGAGDTRVPVLITWTGFLGVRIPLAYWLTGQADPTWFPWQPDLGLKGAWWAMFADLVIRGAFLLLRFRSGRWQSIKV